MKHQKRLGLLFSASSFLFLSLEIPFNQVASANCGLWGCSSSVIKSESVKSPTLLADKKCSNGICVNLNNGTIQIPGVQLGGDENNNNSNNKNNSNNNNDNQDKFRACVTNYLEDWDKNVSAAMDKCERYSELKQHDLRFCSWMYIKYEDYSVPKAMKECSEFKSKDTNVYQTCIDLYENQEGEKPSVAKDKCEDYKNAGNQRKKKKNDD